jgi:hypothetical protein
MTLMVARWLLALGWLRPRAHPPITFRSDLIALHILDTTHPRSIDR